MTGDEAIKITGKGEMWLRTRRCARCGTSIWDALTDDCRALWNKCAPAKQDFTDEKNLQHAGALGGTD